MGPKPLCDGGGVPMEEISVYQPKPTELHESGWQESPGGGCPTEEGVRGVHSAQCKSEKRWKVDCAIMFKL